MIRAERYMGCDWIVVADFFVAGLPKAQPRGRRTSWGGIYNPDTADVWKDAIGWQAKAFKPAQPIEGPVRVWWDAYFPRPKYMMKRGWPDSPVEHTAKPDRDNLDKAILDVLKSLGYFLDDALVCGGECRKYYAAKPSYGQFDQAGCFIFVERKATAQDSGDLQPPDNSSSHSKRKEES